jgi:hypothetical protein
VGVPVRLSICLVTSFLGFLSGCGAANDDAPQPMSTTDSPGIVETGELVDVTPRGLAAGIIEHLGDAKVTYVGGSETDGVLSAMVSTSEPDTASVYVVVYGAPEAAPTRCARDSGYTSLVCKTDGPSTTELGLRGNQDNNLPLLIGRVYDASRTSVLFEVWGTNAESSESLARKLMGDPLLGAVTSRDRNDKGEELSAFEPLQLEVSASTG